MQKSLKSILVKWTLIDKAHIGTRLRDITNDNFDCVTAAKHTMLGPLNA